MVVGGGWRVRGVGALVVTFPVDGLSAINVVAGVCALVSMWGVKNRQWAGPGHDYFLFIWQWAGEFREMTIWQLVGSETGAAHTVSAGYKCSFAEERAVTPRLWPSRRRFWGVGVLSAVGVQVSCVTRCRRTS